MRNKPEREKPPQPALIFRRQEDPRWHLAGYAKAEYYKDGRRMRFSYWSTYEMERRCELSIWVAEFRKVTKEEATELCQT